MPNKNTNTLTMNNPPIIDIPRQRPLGFGQSITVAPTSTILEGMNSIVRWIPVSQSLPDDDTDVLIHIADGQVWTGFVDAGIWRYVSGGRIQTPVLHWAEFPEPPNP
jgi:hypothetical protein